MKIKLGDAILPHGMIRGPFGSALKKSLLVSKSENNYKVYEQGVVLEKNSSVGNYYVTSDYFNKMKRFAVQENDFLVSCSGVNYGAVYQIKGNFEPGIINQALLILRINPVIADYNYFLYYFKSFISKSITIGTGDSTIPNFPSVSVIKNIELDLPPLDTQRKIGNFLYALDDKIALNKKINATLEAIAKTLYDYWFVQFDFPDENGKPYKTNGGKMIYISELGRDIPAGWEVDTLKGKIFITRGISYSTETLSAGTEGMPMINLASVDRKRNYIPSGLKFFIDDVPNEKKLQAKDMLIACTDLTRQAEIIGSPILVMNDREYTFSMDLAKLTVIDEKLNELYLYMTLRTNFYHQYIIGFASGTTVLHLNTSGIEWYKMLIPPMTLQKKFAEVMNNIYLHTCKNICESQRLAELRDWMLPMLMNGQIKF